MDSQKKRKEKKRKEKVMGKRVFYCRTLAQVCLLHITHVTDLHLPFSRIVYRLYTQVMSDMHIQPCDVAPVAHFDQSTENSACCCSGVGQFTTKCADH